MFVRYPSVEIDKSERGRAPSGAASGRSVRRFVPVHAGVTGDPFDCPVDGALGEEGAESGAADSAMADALAVPSEGKPLPQLWMGNSNIAADHAAAGDFTSAMQLLHRQIGVTNFEPLRESFMATYTGAMCSLPGLPSMPAITSYVT